MKSSNHIAEDSKEGTRQLNLEKPWEVVIFYDDVSAGRRAMQTLEKANHPSVQAAELYPSLWRFDHLEVPEWQAAAVVDARQAGLIIISASREGDLPATVLESIECSRPWKAGVSGALMALLGPPGKLDEPDSPRIRRLRNLAEKAGRSFLVPTTPIAAESGAAAEMERHNSPPTAAPTAPARRILLIEDDRAMLHFSSDALRRAGYEVDGVGGGVDAWKAICHHNYDLLVTDNKMPGLTGLDLVRKVRAAQIKLPVIVASRGVCAEDLAASQWIQPAAALPKPFTSVELLQAAAQILAASGAAAHSHRGGLPLKIEPHPHWGINE